MTSAQDKVLSLHEYRLTQDQTRYIVKERDLKELLETKFGQGLDFRISTKSNRWRYSAPAELTADEVRRWISELDTRVARDKARQNLTAEPDT